jgi:hypothetical protein
MDLDESLDINSALGNIGDNTKTSAKENLGYHRLKYYTPQPDDECSKLTNGNRQNYNGCKIQAKSMEINSEFKMQNQ